jgi:hypothetical protein
MNTFFPAQGYRVTSSRDLGWIVWSCIIGGLLAGALVGYNLPRDRWSYAHVQFGSTDVYVRTHRITGKTDRLYAFGWYPVEPRGKVP